MWWTPSPRPADWIDYTPEADAIQLATDVRINAAKEPAVSKELWTVRDHAAASYVHNPDRWTIGWDLSGCAVWTSAGDPNKKTCTLITPTCGIVAAHYPLGNGTTVRFVTPAGEVVTRTVVKGVRHPDYVPASGRVYADLFIVQLDEPVVGCRPAFVLPDDWRNYLPNNGKYLPVVQMCQHEHAGLAMVDHVQDSNNFCHLMPVPGMSPNSYLRNQFAENLIGGDSSDPCLMFYDNLPILMTVWRYGGYGSGASIVGQLPWIDSTCQALTGETPRRIAFVKKTCKLNFSSSISKVAGFVSR